MSQRLPYEDQLQQQWNDISLPDVDMAWADMKRRLEEEDDDRVVAWWRRGCLGLTTLILILLAGGLWLLLKKDANDDKTSSKNQTQKIIQDTIKLQKTSNDKKIGDSIAIRDGNNIKNHETYQPAKPVQQESLSDNNYSFADESSSKTNTITVKAKTNPVTNKRFVQSKPVTSNKRNEQNAIGGKKVNTITADPENLLSAQSNIDKQVSIDNRDSSGRSLDSTIEKPDSIIAKSNSDTALKQTNEVPGSSLSKPDSSQKSKFHFEAGIAIQQQIPLNGQKMTPYNSLGRKGTLLDYIPSAYLRMKKNSTWFIQLEFKYGAPQYTRDILYSQKIKFDTGSNTIITNSSIVKKTYYHQLSLAFHYYPSKNWSIGTGLIWNRFSSAISNDIVASRDAGSQIDSISSSVILKKKQDSAFSKSYLQAVFETQYEWKKFSVGARYAFGLEPYLKFRLPGEPERREKNSSLQVFLRYRLWQSRRK